jgi:hypothetical protein
VIPLFFGVSTIVLALSARREMQQRDLDGLLLSVFALAFQTLLIVTSFA